MAAEQVIGTGVIATRVDADGINAGVAEGKRSLAGLGEAAKKAGADIGAGLGGGPGVGAGAANVDRATKQMIQQIQRTSAAFDAGERNSRRYFESLGAARGVDANALKPWLDHLDQARAKADAASKALNQTAPAMQKVGVSAAQTAAAMRNVPAQMTDIVVSLQAGQAPLTVLLQQGGQLKDMFGGIGPAARALGGYIGSMVTPLTAAAAAIVALGAAAYAGASQVQELQRSVIMAGNQARATAAQFLSMADSIAGVRGGVGGALEALQLMQTEGKVAGDQLERFAQLGVNLERTVGLPVKDLASAFGEMSEDAAKGALKVNQTFGFLTESTYRQIKALQDVGKETEATKVAQDAFASAMEARLPGLVNATGSLERAWGRLKDQIRQTGDLMKSIGRPPSTRDELAAAQAALPRITDRAGVGGPGAGAARQAAEARVESLREQIRLEERAATSRTQADALGRQQLNARLAWDKVREQNLDKQTRKARELAQANEAADKVKASPTERAAVLKEIEDRYTERGAGRSAAAAAARTEKDIYNARLEALKQTNRETQEQTRATVDTLDSLHKRNAIGQIAYIEQVRDAEIASLQAQRAVLAEEVRIAQGRKDNRKQVAQLAGELAVIDTRIANRKTRGDNDVQEVRFTQQAAAAKVAMEQAAEDADALTQAFVANSKASEAAGLAVYEFSRSLKDSAEDQQFEIDLLGQTAQQQRVSIELRRIQIALRQQERAIEGNTNLTGDQQQYQLGQARAAAAAASEGVIARDAVRTWHEANRQIADSLTDAILSGGRSAAASLKAMFRNLVLEPVVRAGVNAVVGAVMGGGPAGAAGGVAGAAGGIGQALSGAGAIGAGLGAIGTAYTAGSTSVGVMAGSIAGGGGVMGGIASALGAVPVAGWIALGALALGKIFGGKGGGPKEGAYVGAESAQGAGNGWGQQAGTVQNAGLASSLTQSAKGISDSFNELSMVLGGRAGASFGMGLLADPKGKAQTMGEVNVRDASGRIIGSASSTTLGRSQEESMAGLTALTGQAMMQALQASGIEQQFVDYFARVANSTDQAAQAAAIKTAIEVASLTRAFDAVAGPMRNFRTLSIDARAGMIELAGGAQALAGLSSSFQNNFYKEAERRDAAFQGLTLRFREMGLEMPTTNRAFRELVERFLQSGEAGATTAVKLLQMNEAFAQLHPLVDDYIDSGTKIAEARRKVEESYAREKQALETTGDRLKTFTDNMRRFRETLTSGSLSVYTPQEKYAQAAATYSITKAQMDAGDKDAQDRFAEVSQAFLEASREVNSSGGQYQTDFQRVLADSTAALGVGEAQLDTNKAQLLALERMVDQALPEIKAELISTREAIQQYLDAGGGTKDVAPPTVLSPAPFFQDRIAPMQGMASTFAPVVQSLEALRAEQARQTGALIGATYDATQAAANRTADAYADAASIGAWYGQPSGPSWGPGQMV